MVSSKTLIPCMALLLLLSMFSFAESREFYIGTNNDSWQVPSSPDEFNKWAEKNRFEICDSIFLKYDSKTDSVLEVTEEDYKTCNKSNPIKSYDDGNTKIVLNKSGPFFFISGAEGHCNNGQKLEIKVLSAKQVHFPVSPAPCLFVNRHHAPSPAPHSGGSVLKVWFVGGFMVAVFLSLI